MTDHLQQHNTNGKESNETDLQIKTDPSAEQENNQIASEKLRYDEADRIYPD